MFIFENDRNEIHDVDNTTDTSLHAVEVTDGTFDKWSKARICCYVADVREGRVVTFYPYVNTIIVEQLDRLGKLDEINSSDIADNREGIMETFETGMTNTDDISTVRDGLIEVYEMLVESEV